MGAKSKSAKIRSSARKSFTKTSSSRGHRVAAAPDVWEAQVPDERDDEIDFERIVPSEGGRTVPPYYDDYN